jgi:tRNA-dihydrouridine synthase B
MNIGSVALSENTLLAPLAGITNLPFRLMIKEFGCGMVCSEMISANGLVYGSQKTIDMLRSSPEEKPVSVQLFGAVPSIMADAAQIVEASGADVLDINFGCSVKKVVKTGSGVALMRTPELAEKLLTAIRKAIDIPLTIKIRTGWEPSGRQALEIAQIAEGCGVDAITVHPRTATQGFRGRADHAITALVKKKVNIPIVGNGDIETAQGAVAMIRETGCDAVMIGRAAMENPWIFSQFSILMHNGQIFQPDLSARFRLMENYLAASVRYLGERHACRMMRSRLSWFVKGLHLNGQFRESIKHLSTEEEALGLIRGYLGLLSSQGV